MTQAAIARLEAWEAGQLAHLRRFAPVMVRGRVQRVSGILLQCRLPGAQIGDLCRVE
ncbi:type III secretion apparatus H+-transporting two-sector ATPase, partial [Pseudomonas sp. CFII68]